MIDLLVWLLDAVHHRQERRRQSFVMLECVCECVSVCVNYRDITRVRIFLAVHMY